MSTLIQPGEDLSQIELADLLEFETLLADIAARFVGVESKDVDREILAALRSLCRFLAMDRAAVWQLRGSTGHFYLTSLIGDVGGRDIPEDPDAVVLFPWVVQQMLQGDTIIVSKMETLPPEAHVDRQNWEYFGQTKSSFVFPLQIAGTTIGILSFDAVHERHWPESITNRCRLIAGVIANALARKRSEDALRDSEERYRSIAQNLPGIVYQFYARNNGKWGLSYVDAKALDVCGLAIEPLDTFFDRFAACVAAEERQSWVETIRQAIAGVKGWEQEFRFNKPTGEEVYFRGVSAPIRLGDQLIFSGLILDVTARKHAELELRRLKEQLQQENIYLRQEVKTLQGTMPIVGNSDALKRVITQAQQVAPTDSNVLILGETGTGKELLASYLHGIGKRSRKPFIVANIAAIPATLLENELFGREKGAYTGAITRQIGRFELADGGVLFLDEIGELPLETQVKLLRVLQSGTFERLGSSRAMQADVQVIAATNRKLPELIKAGVFRQDLYYRLNVFPIMLPPLRERTDDIPLLVWAFLKEFSAKMGKPIERIRKKDMDALMAFPWPGNVRELRNVIERSVILTHGPELHVELPDGETASQSDEPRLLCEVQRSHVQKVLRSVGGKIRGPKGAAQILGLKPTTLYSLMKRLGIERGQTMAEPE